MKNLGGTNLGGNRSVQMIKVGNSILVVGIGENVELLKEINDEQEVNMIIEQFHNRMDQMVKPQDMISKLTALLKTKKGIAEENQSFKKELENQLNDIAEKRRKAYEENVEKGFKDK
jgi:flagellar protein FliO/FliZ